METHSISLDEQQQSVVESTSKNILCIAGPGAGKTRTLVERTADLIEKRKISPHEIVQFTFTRKASREMSQRIEERIGVKAHQIMTGTFHSISLRLFHRFGDLLGYKAQNITVYGEWEEKILLKECAIDLGIFKKNIWKIPKKKIDGVFYEYYHNGKEPGSDDPCYALFSDFMTRCRENHSLTYGGLLVGFKKLLPHITKYLKWKHIMVDEAHDNNLIQWELILDIQKACNSSLFIVTDLDQSIYHWRGALPEW
ncbi:unnamed protein product, partial [marine sediment metagenome]